MKTREIIPLKQSPHWTVKLPGSKSITNRAFICAAMAKGKSRIYGALESEDTNAMLNALRNFQCPIANVQKAIVIEGNGGKFKSGSITVDAGASGTTTRFLTALALLRKGKTTIKGTKRMKERPIKDLTDALSHIKAGKTQIKMKGDKSSQFLSAILMIAPMLPDGLKIEIVGELVSKPYIDTTLAVMKAFGVQVGHQDHKVFQIKPQAYKARKFTVEGDASAASYWSAINFLHKGYLEFENLNYKKSIQGDVNFPEALKQLKKRSPRTIDMEAMPDVSMTLAAVAPFVSGKTKITGLSTLKIKETDRLKAMETELRKVGVDVKAGKDSLTIAAVISKRGYGSSPSADISTYDDHRMAMSFAVLGTKFPGVTIEDPDSTAKTYPNFWEDLERAYFSPIKLGRKNLVLIGMRCSGKTHHGKRIAKLLGRKFVDLDKEIEREEKMEIHDIVKSKGWPYFRKVEQKICTKFAPLSGVSKDKSDPPLVIATGGGVVLSPKNMKAFHKDSVVVFVYTDPHVICERLMKTAMVRPSLTGKKVEHEIHELWEARRPLYIKYADYVWDDTSGWLLEANYKKIFGV